ncbi:uncharacterized protein LOC125178388 [Hyalella azteca]|uniref:Uncharacterized protein LOC125178388 n=1 Tax=Hyalella azteca TaxID=294128 RepID=A0A979FN87_HYAAZ|nr:uncharacterized protein LOC125178388 [Hyalella azteca]
MAYDTMEPSILKVFIYQAQKGEKLTPNLNMILLNKLSTGQLPALKLEMLSCLGSLIEANQTDIGRYLPQVNQILTEQISSDNNVVQNMCITAVRKLITFCKHVDEDLLQKLVDVATRSDCNEYVRNEIALTFGLIKDEYNPVIKLKQFREKLHLANLHFISPKNVLEHLKCYTNVNGSLLEQNYLQLIHIIDNESMQLQEEALLFSTPCIKRCQQIVTECPTFDEIIQEIHQLAVENHFQVEGKVKDLNELLDELRDKNQSESELVCKLKEQNSLNIQQSIFQEQEDKLTWNKKQIVSWAEQFKPGSGKTFTDNEAIAVIYRANYLVNGHELTYPQILCSLIALKTVGSNNGKLLEVATGEGKSTIISILAIIYSLRGKNVDILTSSPILAERDAKQQAKLYKMFNLKCSDNSDKTIYLKGKKDCYSANIVYGEMSQFQFDILRDNYSKLDTLGDRNLCVAIVDEVDSMLIDDSSKIARLSSTVPGIDHLQALYVFIWQHLVSIKSRLFMVNNKLYFVKGTLGFDDGAFTLEYADANGDIMKIPDLEVHFAQVRGRSPLAEAVEDLDEFLRNSLMFYLNDVMEQNTIYIPRHFANFIENQKSEWIKNAVEALRFQENVQYIVQDGKIKPVDYHNTGIVQSFTSWGDGLQQFLQLKHNLKMTSETLITNFLSNVGLVHKYEHVCGLTGTLGSKAARKLLKSVYSVQLLNIPEKRKKLFLQLESIVVEDEDSWMEEIAANIVLESKKKRGILVVCETIESAVQVSDLVKNKLHPHSLKLYTINDVNQEKNIEKIRPGQVIIATNLAGRGTDIRTDEIEATGGLHVILTFMPTNQRVEDQAFGRTARQGRRGTGIMILNAQNGDGFRGNTIGMSNKTMKEQRDIIESEQLHTFQNHELKLIQVKDELFDIFCSFLNEVRVQIRKETRSKLSIVRNWFTEGEPTVYELCMLAALEEQWAAFLRKLDNYEIKCEEAEDKCRALIDQLRIYFRKNQLFKNPYYLITIANDMLVNTGTVPTSNTNEALGFFQKAVHLDHSNQRKRLKTSSKSVEVSQEEKDVFSPGAAHVGIAWCKLLLKEKGYKDEALSSFKVALKCLANEMSVLNATQLLLEQRQAGFVDSPLYNQLNTQASIIGSYMNGIESSINALKRSKRMIDLVAVKRHEVTAGKPGILETITHHNDLERSDQEKCLFKNENLKLSSGENYSLTFNHLTTREDLKTIDQAIIILDNAFDKNLLHNEKHNLFGLKNLVQSAKSEFSLDGFSSLAKESYRDVKINVNKVDIESVISAFFNTDQELKGLRGEKALLELKQERSESRKISLVIRSNDDDEFEEIFNGMQTNQLVKIVEGKMENADLCFDIVIKTNKLSKASVILNVEFHDLNQKAAEAKLQSINSNLVHVGLALNKSDLLHLLNLDASLASGTLLVGQNHVHEKLNRELLIVRAHEQKEDHSFCYVRFDDLKFDQANKIVKNCSENAAISLSFCEIDDVYNAALKGKADLSFTELNQTSAEIVIQELRKKNFEFSLEFQKLSSKEVSFILNGANLEQEDMEITSVKNVRDLFTKGSAPAYELDQFAARGLEHIIELNEKLFVPWRSVAAVAALGISQIIIGSVLIAIGLGSPFGWGIVTEGASDLPMAFKAYKTRQFNWRDYSKQKTVSLAISAATMGINYWETGLNAASSAVFSEVGREVMEQAGVQVVVNRKLAGQVVLNTSKNLKSLAGKACRKAAMAVAKECTSTAIQHLSDFSFALLKPKICESVQSKVTSAFKRHPELVIILRQLNAIDRVAKSHRLQIKVDNIVKKTSSIVITDFMKNENVSICSPLIKCVLSDSNMNGGNASIPTKVITTLNGLHQVNILADKIIEALLTKLRVFDAYSSTISLILIRDLKIRKDFAIVIAKKLKELEIFDENDNFLVDGKTTTKEKIDKLMHDWKTTPQLLMDELSRQLKEYSTLKADLEKCIEFTNELYDTFVNSDFECVSTVIKSVSDQIAQQLVKVMDPLLMQPWPPGYSMAENGLTDSISNHGAEIKYQKLLVKPGLTEEELTFMANYRKFRTVTQLLDRNARDHLTTHSNDGLNYNTITDDATRIPLDPSVHRMANDIREGKSINLALMSTLAKANGIKVKFVDDLQYTKTQEDVENDVEVMYVKEDRERRVSFALCLNSDGKFKKIEGRSHCCVFEAFSEILARKCIVKSVAELRAELADQIVLNSESFSEEIAAEAWVVKKYSDSSKRSFSVGLFHDETGKLEIVKCDDMAMIDDIRIDANHDAAAAGSFERAAERVGLSRRGSVQNSDSWHPAEHRGSSSSVQDLAKAITENKHSQSGLLERVVRIGSLERVERSGSLERVVRSGSLERVVRSDSLERVVRCPQ